ncbi:DUF89 domain-containing protein [Candidatus Hydrogenedentota bacterium]
MKARLDCYPCFLTQALTTARYATDDEALHLRVLQEVSRKVSTLEPNATPAELSMVAYESVEKVLGIADPYYEQKREHNKMALDLFPELKKLVGESDNPLHTAARLSAGGNVIDLGIGGTNVDVEAMLAGKLLVDFAVDDFDRFTDVLDGAEYILYCGDNAGEIVFDRLLVEELAKTTKVYFAVKSGPIINDALFEDAIEVGMDACAEIITTGSKYIGAPLKYCSQEFLDLFHSSRVIISKGQGNFETLSGEPGNIFFILKAKCPCVAEELGIEFGECVFMDHERAKRS